MPWSIDDIIGAAKHADDIAEEAAKYGGEALGLGKRAYNFFLRNTDEVEKARKAERAALEAMIKNRPAGQTVVGATRNYKMEQRAAKAAAKAKNKNLNPSLLASLPTWSRRLIKAGVPLGVLGAAAGAYNYFTGDSKPSTSLDYSGWDLGPMTGSTSGSSILDDYVNQKYQRQLDELNKYYSSINVHVPGQEIYDPMSKISTQLGAASSGAMSDLANQYAQSAASIKQGGQQGAASINDIYGDGAANMESVASQAGGQYGGMIPVYGAAATAPAEQVAAGKDLANYLAQNQLISAQTQGGMAELAQMLGPAYANQYALIDAQMRAQAEAQKALKEAEMRQALEMEKAGAMSDLMMTRIAEEAQKGQTDYETAQRMQLLATPETIRQLASEYEDLDDRDRAYYANNFGVDSAEAYVRFRLNSMAKYGQ